MNPIYTVGNIEPNFSLNLTEVGNKLDMKQCL